MRLARSGWLRFCDALGYEERLDAERIFDEASARLDAERILGEASVRLDAERIFDEASVRLDAERILGEASARRAAVGFSEFVELVIHCACIPYLSATSPLRRLKVHMPHVARAHVARAHQHVVRAHVAREHVAPCA